MTNKELFNKVLSEKGVTKSFLARKCGITRQHFYAMENGRGEFKGKHIRAICEALRIEDGDLIDAIFFGADGAFKSQEE